MKIIKNYIINENTVAIIGINNESSKIIENNDEFIIKSCCNKIIEESCLFYGSSYQGRVDASSLMIKNSYKVPILVENSKNIVIFPTISPNSNLCMWIVIDKIKKINFLNSKIVKILFKNNIEINTNMSKFSIENQMLKSYILQSNMKDRNLI